MQRAIRSTRAYFRRLTFVLIVISTFASRAASAQEPFIGEIRWVGFNFAPRGWALCDGRILSIAQNTALCSLLGTTYGGNGQTTFALPDMRGRVPLHAGTGPGPTPRTLGEAGGQEAVTLTTAELPSHTHGLTAHTSTTRVRQMCRSQPAALSRRRAQLAAARE